jgi:hypothetical protein
MRPGPEFNLLVCLAGTEIDVPRAQSLLNAPIDWSYFQALAWRHGLLPLVTRNLRELESGDVPAEALNSLTEKYQHNAARNLLLTSELVKIIQSLIHAGVESVGYKGPVLALQAYGDVKLRSFVDLDLLVRPVDAHRAAKVLSSIGYQPHLDLTPTQEALLPRTECDRVFLREGRNLIVELHWAIAPPYFGVELTIDDLLINHCEQIDMFGTTIKAPRTEMMLLLLCLNGAKDAWIALEPLCAIAELLRRSSVDLDATLRLARRARVHRIVGVGLELARQIFGATLDQGTLSAIHADHRVSSLVSEATVRLTSELEPEPGLFEKARFHLHLRERSMDKVRYSLRRMFTPTYKDCATELPRQLTFLYYGLRPFRLAGGLFKRPKTDAVL